MILIIFVLVLFAGVAFFQTIQGAFSALLMLVLTLLSAAVAVNFYGPISREYLLANIPDYADATALVVLFAATLVILRTVADNFIRGNVVVYEWPDRIVAGVLSIPTALVLVGLSSIGFQMLPFDDQVMWFNRWTDNNGQLERSSLFPKPDDFAASILSRLSQGSLQSTQKLAMAHPDWPGEASAQRIGVQRESTHAVPPGSVRVTQAWKRDRESPLLVKEFPTEGKASTSYKRNANEKETLKIKDKRFAREGYYYLVTRMVPDAKAADGDGVHRFGWGQVRLVGFLGADRNYPLNIYAMGVRNPQFGEFDYLRVKVPVRLGTDQYDEEQFGERNYGFIKKDIGEGIDVVFEVPENFTPWFLEYKRWARATLPKIAETDPDKSKAPAPKAEAPGTVGEVAQAGWHNQFQLTPQGTGFKNELPFKLVNNASRVGATVSGNRLTEAKSLTGRVGGTSPDRLDGGQGETVTEFDVPADKRLLQVQCQFSPAQTQMLQKIFAHVQGVAQVKVTDTGGNAYLPVGKYIIADQADGTKLVELIYDVSPEAIMASRPEPFRQVKVNDLEGKGGTVGFLYLIPPGTQLKEFQAGGRPFQTQTLQIKAPQ